MSTVKRILLFLFAQLFCVSSLFASNTISYSGRLVKSDGSPVSGSVNLKAELAYSSNYSNILCSQHLSNVSLMNGVFHINLDMDCSPNSFINILTDVPSNNSVVIRIIDETNTARPKSYPFQSIHSIPFSILSNMSKQLVQMGASNGHILTWDNGQWKPLPPAVISSGSIGSSELASGSVTNEKIANGISRSKLAQSSNIGYVLVNSPSGLVGEVPFLAVSQGGTGSNNVVGARANLGITIGTGPGQFMAADAVPSCASNQKLQMSPGPVFVWDCVSAEDDTKLPTIGGIMTGAIDMSNNRIIDLGTPTSLGDAANKAYVDSEIESLNLFMTNSGMWSKVIDDINYTAGNVSIGTTAVGEKLEVAGNIKTSGKIIVSPSSVTTAKIEVEGQILSRVFDAGMSTTINWDNGNLQYTTASCGNFSFSNMHDGGSYTLIVKGPVSGLCTFSQISPASISSSDFKFVPVNAPTFAGKETIYTLLRAGSTVYVSWIPGF